MKLVFATNNRHKLEEVQQLLGSSYRLITPLELGITEDIPENQATLEGNALEKAYYVYNKTGIPCFADDTGLEAAALNGAPGVHSARYSGSDKDPQKNIDKLLSELIDSTNRKAQFRTVVAYVDGSKEYLFEGKVEGEILPHRTGDDGFGYDSVFQPAGYSQSFAEMPLEEKNKISHRGEAIRKLVAFLKKRNLK